MGWVKWRVGYARVMSPKRFSQSKLYLRVSWMKAMYIAVWSFCAAASAGSHGTSGPGAAAAVAGRFSMMDSLRDALRLVDLQRGGA